LPRWCSNPTARVPVIGSLTGTRTKYMYVIDVLDPMDQNSPPIKKM